MPRLLVFLPAEKVLIDSGDNSLTIVGVLSSIEVGIQKDTSLPENAGVPMQWATITIWRIEDPSEDGVTFQQRVELVSPSGKRTLESTMDFVLPEGVSHRNRSIMQGFPIGEPGQYTLRLSVRKLNVDEDWRYVADYPIKLSHRDPIDVQFAG
jgi:hypothetical protein